MRHVHLAVVHEVEDTHQLSVLDTLQIKQRVIVGIFPENVSEEGTAGADDHFMSLDLVIILTGKRHVKKLFIVSNFSKC